MSRPLFRQVSIIGLGLIGGSLGMALRRGRVARRVIGFTRREATLRRALAKGAIDDGDTELCPDWLSESDLVVIATPPLTVPRLAREAACLAHRPLIITDVASTKAEIVRALERGLPRHARFVGAHPMAGSNRSGIEAADAHLFRGAVCVVTPTVRTSSAAAAKVASLWRGVGCRVARMSPDRHDMLVAEVSHLPHLAAAALVQAVSPAAFTLAGNGFRDTTRVAQGDPALWEEICRTNRKEVFSSLNRLIAELKLLRGAVESRRFAVVLRELRAARRRRKSLRG